MRPASRGHPSKVFDRLKAAPGASYGVLNDQRREVYPQAPVIRESYPRLFTPPPFRPIAPIHPTTHVVKNK